MAYPVGDTFNDKRGRWNVPNPWDDTIFVEAASGTADDFLATQQHVDLRSFRVAADFLTVPQYPDLDTVPQDPYLDDVFQTNLEIKSGDIFSEGWLTDSNGGITRVYKGVWDVTVAYVTNDIVEYKGKHYRATGNSTGSAPGGVGAPWTLDFFYGKIAARGGWYGLQVVTDGAALNTVLRSSIPGDNVDISQMDKLSIVFPNYNTFTGASSLVQLTSKADGTFGDSTFNSTAVAFTGNTAAMPELRLPLSSFTSGAGAAFTLASVTGIKITLVHGGPAAAQTITVMAVRAVKDAWVQSALDFDTRWGIITPPVTLTGNAYAGSVADAFEFIRGDGSPRDPYPTDGAYTLFFYGGGETSPADAVPPAVNTLAIILRETKDATAPNDGSAIIARLKWNEDLLKFEAQRRDTDNGVTSYTTLYEETISASGPDPDFLYAWTVKLVGKSMDSKILQVNRSHDPLSTVWTLETLNDVEFTFRNGRVGFMADLLNRDAYVSELAQAPVGFATLTTRVYETRTPVDGARLQAIFAPDGNLFSELTGPDAFRDQTKTVSGYGGIRTLSGLDTNQFVVDDWYETYLEASIWVPANVSRANQPFISLTTGTASYPIVMPSLQPSQWNKVKFELRRFKDLVTGLPYRFNFSPGQSPDTPLGFFWVDAVTIGRRKVSWSIRAEEGGQWRRFYGLVNDPKGAVHFNPDERGRSLQLRAEALTNDAWVSEFTLFPHYAELGLPLYDHGFETR